MEELSLAVVGVDYPNADGSNRRFEIEMCRPGDAIELRHEPTNEHDPRAVAVWRAGGGQMGYLTAERAGWIGRRLQEEEAVAVYQGFEHRAAYIRVRFGGGAPTVPPVRIVAKTGVVAADDDFYPDPEGPEFGA